MFHSIRNISVQYFNKKQMDKSLSKYSIKLQNHANRKSKAWAFFGMVLLTENNKSIEEDKVFCKLCFEEQKKDDETMIFSW